MPMTETQTAEIVSALARAYNDEIETVANYIANSEHLDGVRAKHIKQSLAVDVTEELNHAQMLAKRIKTIGGAVPGSQSLTMTQTSLQPPQDTTDVIAVIKGVIDAERGAVSGYERIIQLTDGVDPVTQDLAVTLLADEQEHLREFVGFLKEYER